MLVHCPALRTFALAFLIALPVTPGSSAERPLTFNRACSELSPANFTAAAVDVANINGVD